MIQELLPAAIKYDLEPGEVLEVHAFHGAVCECCRHTFDVYDGRQGMIVQGRKDLWAFAREWSEASPWLNRIVADETLYAFAWLAIVHETGIALVRTNLETQEAAVRA